MRISGWHSKNWMCAVRPIQLSMFLYPRMEVLVTRGRRHLLVFDLEVDIETVEELGV